MVAATLTHPIDTVKIQMQVQKVGADGSKPYKTFLHALYKIASEEGIKKGVGKGYFGSLIRELPYSTFRLGLYRPIKELLGEVDPTKTPMWKRFLSGAMAGGIASVISNPGDLLKTKAQSMRAGEWQPLRWHVSEIYNKNGVPGFYRGVLPSVTRATFLGSAYLGTYDSAKHFLKGNGYMEEGIKLQFMASVMAGFNVTVITSPFDNIKTRIMSQPAGTKQYSGMIDCAKKMYKNDGARSFTRGFMAAWARFAPYTSSQLLIWEFLRRQAGYDGF